MCGSTSPWRWPSTVRGVLGHLAWGCMGWGDTESQHLMRAIWRDHNHLSTFVGVTPTKPVSVGSVWSQTTKQQLAEIKNMTRAAQIVTVLSGKASGQAA